MTKCGKDITKYQGINMLTRHTTNKKIKQNLNIMVTLNDSGWEDMFWRTKCWALKAGVDQEESQEIKETLKITSDEVGVLAKDRKFLQTGYDYGESHVLTKTCKQPTTRSCV
jgi:hypothetical protein